MGSDNYFDYHSSQDDADIEYEIDLFEIRYYAKINKQKSKIPSFPIPRKHDRSEHPLIKIYGINIKETLEVEQKIIRYKRYPPKKPKKPKKETKIEFFDYSCVSPDPSLEEVRPQDFTTFRQQFYRVNYQEIRSSFKNQPHIEFRNIRLAPIDVSVQNDFMKRLNQDTSYYPHLVYHGTKLANFDSILRYGFLIPNQSHPTNRKAPMITTQNGSAYGPGIYSSETAHYSLSYAHTTSTLLVCAALPKRDDHGFIERLHGNILVLLHVSEIIPLFLLDYQYAKGSGSNQPWYGERYSGKYKVVEEDPNKPLIVSRKYLRKVLNCTKNQVQRIRRRRGRRNNRHKLRKEEECQLRVFEIFS